LTVAKEITQVINSYASALHRQNTRRRFWKGEVTRKQSITLERI